MGRIFIEHTDDIPWGPRKSGKPGRDGYIGSDGRTKFVGDPELGPWVIVMERYGNSMTPVHSHSTDEVLYVISGEARVGGQACKPGTVAYIEKGTPYSIEAGPEGVTLLNVRPGVAGMHVVERPTEA